MRVFSAPLSRGEASRRRAGGCFSILTAHAQTRMQQRGIRPSALEKLLDEGRVRRGPGDCDIVLLDKTYAVIGSDGAVVTVGHRYRRIPRD